MVVGERGFFSLYSFWSLGLKMANKQSYQSSHKQNDSYHSVTLDSDKEPLSPPKDTQLSTMTPRSNSADDDPLIAGGGATGDNDSEDLKKEVQWNTKHILKIVLGAGIGSLLEFYSFGLVAYFEPGIKTILKLISRAYNTQK